MDGEGRKGEKLPVEPKCSHKLSQSERKVCCHGCAFPTGYDSRIDSGTMSVLMFSRVWIAYTVFDLSFRLGFTVLKAKRSKILNSHFTTIWMRKVHLKERNHDFRRGSGRMDNRIEHEIFICRAL